MKKSRTGSSVVLDLRLVPCLFVLLVGVAPAVLGPGTSATPYPPIVVHTTLITGPDQGVSGPTAPSVRLADLDNGFAAGIVRHVYDGTIWINVRVPFLWSEKDDTATLLEPPKDLVLTPSWYLANAMTPDGSTVVGAVIFPETLTTAPWIWTNHGSRQVDLLPIPGRKAARWRSPRTDGWSRGSWAGFSHPAVRPSGRTAGSRSCLVDRSGRRSEALSRRNSRCISTR